ncbi:insulinase family protein [Leptospira montravelensis]|uniref:Insulinase family protein n=1 Tax=Leptospira montravelensis TaxID=2484961 RepID=A0ABY2LUN2_9LEPT|nr:pitrilysin family protein [Leptospira montravelensis]TGK83916.1 insulinase family protein [Leptospira montravelensis]TGL05923.1 insulinase family protein [Leptospira montravelensis]
MASVIECKRTVLPNGLTVLFQPMKHASSMGVGVFLKQGSLAETNSEHGYFHFLEHMLFKDTKTRTSKEIAESIERVGGILNGSTGREYTQYYVVAIKNQAELAFEILSDMLFRPLFRKEDIQTEKGVIMEEMRSYEDAPDDFVYDYYFRNIFGKSPYGRDIIGTKKSVTGVSEKSIRTFFEKHYFPKNMVISVSGNFTWEKILDLTNKYFSFENPKGKNPTELIIPAPKKSYSKHLERRKIEQFHIMLGVNGNKRDYRTVTVSQLISTILGGGMASRLFQNIREKEGLCYSIYSFPSYYKTTGLFSISSATSKEKAARCVELILKELESISKNGFSKSELADAKSNQMGSIAIGYELPENRMNNIGLQEIYYGKYFSLEDRMKSIKSVTLEEINESAKQLFDLKKVHLSCVGDMSESQFSKIPTQFGG